MITLNNRFKKTGLTVSASLLLAACVLLSGCGGGGGGGGSGGSNSVVNPAPAANNSGFVQCPVIPAVGAGTAPNNPLRGRVTFDRIPFKTAPANNWQPGPGLDYSHPQVLPARGVVVEAVAAAGGSCSGTVLATTTTDGDGWYGFDVDSDQPVCVRARAELSRTDTSGPGWDLSVVDNTDNNSLYVMADNRFSTPRNEPRRDLHAASGWAGSYTGARVAAPFAILDTACKAMDAVLGVQNSAQFGAMTFRWSTRNTESTTGALTDGKIGGAFFSPGASAIYLRGDAATNTDEFDEMVIAHEFGHFVTNRFARSDTTGGDHGLADRLDPRLAFDEGWATAFAGLVLHSNIYRDSDEVTGEYYFFLDNLPAFYPKGWFAEGSIQKLIYGFGEAANNDGVDLGFAPIWQLLTGPYRYNDAMQTIFSFAKALKGANPNYASAIADRLRDEYISGDAIDDFAQGESNAPDVVRDLPVYKALDTGAAQRVCSRNTYRGSTTGNGDKPNKLSMVRYLRFDAPNGRFRVSATPQQATGLAGLEIYRQGKYISCGATFSSIESLIPGQSVALTCPMSSGTYVVAVYQTDFANDPTVDQCFDVTVQPQ